MGQRRLIMIGHKPIIKAGHTGNGVSTYAEMLSRKYAKEIPRKMDNTANNTNKGIQDKMAQQKVTQSPTQENTGQKDKNSNSTILQKENTVPQQENDFA